jgi:hypothetical protein
MNLTPTIIEYYDNLSSNCNYWRCHGVLSELSREGHINLIHGTWHDEWNILRCADVAFFQRPMSKNCLNQVLSAKDHGLKIVVDIDDSTNPEPHNPSYIDWVNEFDELAFTKIMLCADAVIVTNDYLKDFYSKYHHNIYVIPNAINDYYMDFSKPKQDKAICYRGGNNHVMDLWEYRKEIINVMNTNPNWTFYSIGYDADFIKKKVKNYQYLGDFTIHQYFAQIKNLAPEIFIVPLEETEFNHTKSNIAWIEATTAGSATLTPNWWKLNKVSETYKNKATFEIGLRKLISSQNLRQEYYEKSKELIQKKYSLSKVNKKRLEIIKSVLK